MTEEKAGLAIEMEPEEPFRKFYTAETKALHNGDVECYVSTETPDRVGDVILAAGWDVENFKKTGAPVLFGHHYGITPGGGIPHIGKAVEIEVQQKGLWAVTRFHEKTQLSREAALLARDGEMNSWSVGFNPKAKPKVRTKDDEDGGEFVGYLFEETELLEYSLVPVPCNPDATSRCMKMLEKGAISQQMFNHIREGAALFARPSAQREKDSGEDAVALEDVSQHLRMHDIATGFVRRTRS